MKTFRLVLLLLLAVLLPLRGALAAGMLCPVGSFGVQAEAAQLSKHAHAHAEAGGLAHEHQHHEAFAQENGASHEHTKGGSHDHAGATDKCNLCSAFCSVTGLVSVGVTVAVFQPASAVFSHLYAPPPSFVSDGHERPPRTI